MKTNLLFFALGCLFVISIAATPVVQDLITVKPAQPKSVIVSHDLTDYTSQNYIITGYERGYILKTIQCTSGSNSIATFLIVMEKY